MIPSVIVIAVIFACFSLILVAVIIRDQSIIKHINTEMNGFDKRLHRLKAEVEDVNTVDKRAVVDKILTCIEDLDALKQLIRFRELQEKKKKKPIGKIYTGKGAKFIS